MCRVCAVVAAGSAWTRLAVAWRAPLPLPLCFSILIGTQAEMFALYYAVCDCCRGCGEWCALHIHDKSDGFVNNAYGEHVVALHEK